MIVMASRNGLPRISIVGMACTAPPTSEIHYLWTVHPVQEGFEKPKRVPIEDPDDSNPHELPRT
jgi:hypothetical protein